MQNEVDITGNHACLDQVMEEKVCHLCQSNLEDLESLLHHYSFSHNLRCQKCHLIFEDSESLHRHAVIAHFYADHSTSKDDNNNDTLTPNQQMQCLLCCSQVLDISALSQHYFLRHSTISRNDGYIKILKFNCLICSSSFVQKSLLHHHSFSHKNHQHAQKSEPIKPKKKRQSLLDRFFTINSVPSSSKSFAGKSTSSNLKARTGDRSVVFPTKPANKCTSSVLKSGSAITSCSKNESSCTSTPRIQPAENPSKLNLPSSNSTLFSFDELVAAQRLANELLKVEANKSRSLICNDQVNQKLLISNANTDDFNTKKEVLLQEPQKKVSELKTDVQHFDTLVEQPLYTETAKSVQVRGILAKTQPNGNHVKQIDKKNPSLGAFKVSFPENLMRAQMAEQSCRAEKKGNCDSTLSNMKLINTGSKQLSHSGSQLKNDENIQVSDSLPNRKKQLKPAFPASAYVHPNVIELYHKIWPKEESFSKRGTHLTNILMDFGIVEAESWVEQHHVILDEIDNRKKRRKRIRWNLSDDENDVDYNPKSTKDKKFRKQSESVIHLVHDVRNSQEAYSSSSGSESDNAPLDKSVLELPDVVQ